MMTQGDALAEVMKAPAQDEARLVYADLLSEIDDPQGEFIVVQCQMAQLERQGLDHTPRYAELKQRERTAELKVRQRRSPWWDAGIIWRKFDRGFVTRLEVRKADAMRLLGELKDDPFFSAVCRLELAEATPLAIAQLTALDGFTSLRALRLARKYATHSFGLTGARQLAAWAVLRNVVDLRVRNEQVEDAGLTALLTSPHLKNLKQLTIGHNSSGLRQVFRIDSWPTLCGLELSGCRLTADEVESLTKIHSLKQLTSLSLAANHLGDDGAKVLAATRWPLTEIDLGYTGLTDEGLVALVETRERSFKKMVLTSADIGPSVQRMARRHRSLQTLMLNETQVDDQHIMAMCGMLDGSLQRLSLQGTSVTVRSVDALRACPRLKALSLTRTEIGNAGAEVLAASPEFASLEQLDLDLCSVNAEGCRALLESPHLSRTLNLSLATAGLPESLLRALRERFVVA